MAIHAPQMTNDEQKGGNNSSNGRGKAPCSGVPARYVPPPSCPPRHANGPPKPHQTRNYDTTAPRTGKGRPAPAHAYEQRLVGWITGASNVGRCQQTMPPHNKKRNTVQGTDDNDAEQHSTHPHVYEHLLVGWIVGVYREGGGRQRPSTRPPPLRALARRVDRVLTAMPSHNDDEQYSSRTHAYEPLLVGWIAFFC
jgi:hypothetical protein